MHIKLDFPYFTLYRTPWRDQVCPSKNKGETVHFFYPLHALAEEILMITSMLGGRRGTETAPHLLDLVAMTKDETPEFISLVKSTMAKVFLELSKYTNDVESAYNFDEGHPSVCIKTESGTIPILPFHKGDWVIVDGIPYIAKEDGNSQEPNYIDKLVKQPADFRHSVHYTIGWRKDMNDNCKKPLDQFLFDALKYGVIYEWLHIAFPNEEQAYLVRYQEALNNIRTTCGKLKTAYFDRIPRVF